MECDKDFRLINQKTRIDLPEEWAEVFKSARAKPTPFDVVEVTQDMFKSWTAYFPQLYKAKCLFKSRSIREMKSLKEDPQLLYFRATWHGAWETAVVVDFKKWKKYFESNKVDAEFELPGLLYHGK